MPNPEIPDWLEQLSTTDVHVPSELAGVSMEQIIDAVEAEQIVPMYRMVSGGEWTARPVELRKQPGGDNPKNILVGFQRIKPRE